MIELFPAKLKSEPKSNQARCELLSEPLLEKQGLNIRLSPTPQVLL